MPALIVKKLVKGKTVVKNGYGGKSSASVPIEGLKPFVEIDFPKDGEHVNPPYYAIRLSTNASGAVQISIDQGAWQTCRSAVGFYWYDWTNMTSGKHTCIARIQTGQGKYKKSKSITCFA
jgi:hypothetical protein